MNQPIFKIDQFTAILFSSIIFIYFLVNLYRLTSLELVTRFLLILLTLILCVLILRKYKEYGIPIYQLKFYLPFFLLHIVYVLNVDLGKLDLNNTLTILYQLFFITLIFSLSSFTWSRLQIRLLSLLSYIAIIMLLAQILLNSNILNTNSIGAYTYFFLYFPLLYLIGYTKKNFKFIRLITILGLATSVILLSDTRSIIICAAIGIITWSLWKIISRYKILFYGYFSVLLTVGFIFTMIYANADKYIPNIGYYSDLVYKYTGKNLFSGREYLWSHMIDNINERVFFGHGSSSQLSDFLNTDLAAHNLYLQIALQVGVVGLLLFLYFFLNIWKAIWLNRQDARVKLFACYFLGIIMYQLFELSLLQNNLSLAIVQWLIIGIGLSFNKNKLTEKEKTAE